MCKRQNKKGNGPKYVQVMNRAQSQVASSGSVSCSKTLVDPSNPN